MINARALLNEIRENGGFEAYGFFLSQYPAKVEDVNDPENSGRIRFFCPDVLRGELSDWAEFQGIASGNGSGVWFPVQKGDSVWASFRSGNPECPLWAPGFFTKNAKPSNDFIIKLPTGQFITIRPKADEIEMATGDFRIKIGKESITAAKKDGSASITLQKDEIAAKLGGAEGSAVTLSPTEVSAKVGPLANFKLGAAEFSASVSTSKISLTQALASITAGAAPLPNSAILGDLFLIHYAAFMGLLGSCPTILTAAGTPLATDPIFQTLLTQIPQLASKGVKVS